MRTLRNHRLLRVAALVALAAMLLCVPAFAAEEGAEAANGMYGTFWALVPPIIAITLALITKEAYSSLFIGVLVGALFSCEFAPVATLDMIVNDGLVAAVADNAGIFLFLVFLGINRGPGQRRRRLRRLRPLGGEEHPHPGGRAARDLRSGRADLHR